MSENENVQEQNVNETKTTKKNWNYIPSFLKFCLAYGMIPTSYKLAMTYEEQILWIINFITNDVMQAIENDSKAIEELQEGVDELWAYINDLDVPQIVKDEIDEMIESGTFEELFGAYVDPKIDELQEQIDTINDTIGNLNLPTTIDPETRRTC